MCLVDAKISFSYGFKTRTSFNMIDFITKRMQSFEINAYCFTNNAPLTLMLFARKLSRLTFCGQILCDFKISLIIGVSHDTKRI